jgi:hypothetical protein
MKLEAIIADLVKRKNAATGAERKMLERELTGLRYSYKDAGPIIEDWAPIGWGSSARPLPVREGPKDQPVRTLTSPRKTHAQIF